MVAGAEKAGRTEMTGDAWTHEVWGGECLHESGRDVMLVGVGRLQFSCICKSMA